MPEWEESRNQSAVSLRQGGAPVVLLTDRLLALPGIGFGGKYEPEAPDAAAGPLFVAGDISSATR